ncbi:MAG: chemotaxis protein CheB, partial [Gemmatimonadota bacterium]
MSESTSGSPAAPSPEADRSLNLVAIGASAGGIAALRALFEAVPEETGIAFVVVMHLSPEHESQLAEVLQPHVKIPVRQVRERTRIRPDQVYVIPPDRSMAVTDGHLELSEFEEPRGRRSPIDTFFRTVAEIHPDGVGILLSGSGTDGVIGLKAIKELGGIVMAQSPEDAEYDSMPRAAVATGLVDVVLPARALGKRVVELRSSGRPWTLPGGPGALKDGEQQQLRKILSQLRVRTGH